MQGMGPCSHLGFVDLSFELEVGHKEYGQRRDRCGVNANLYQGRKKYAL